MFTLRKVAAWIDGLTDEQKDRQAVVLNASTTEFSPITGMGVNFPEDEDHFDDIADDEAYLMVESHCPRCSAHLWGKSDMTDN